MTLILAVVIGVLYGCGFYLMLRRSIVKLLIGLAIIGNAANLLIFTASRPVRGFPALVLEGETQLAAAAADPLPQAMILTAIVISFGVISFSIVLLGKVYESARTDDIDAMRASEQ